MTVVFSKLVRKLHVWNANMVSTSGNKTEFVLEKKIWNVEQLQVLKFHLNVWRRVTGLYEA